MPNQTAPNSGATRGPHYESGNENHIIMNDDSGLHELLIKELANGIKKNLAKSFWKSFLRYVKGDNLRGNKGRVLKEYIPREVAKSPYFSELDPNLQAMLIERRIVGAKAKEIAWLQQKLQEMPPNTERHEHLRIIQQYKNLLGKINGLKNVNNLLGAKRKNNEIAKSHNLGKHLKAQIGNLTNAQANQATSELKNKFNFSDAEMREMLYDLGLQHANARNRLAAARELATRLTAYQQRQLQNYGLGANALKNLGAEGNLTFVNKAWLIRRHRANVKERRDQAERARQENEMLKRKKEQDNVVARAAAAKALQMQRNANRRNAESLVKAVIDALWPGIVTPEGLAKATTKLMGLLDKKNSNWATNSASAVAHVLYIGLEVNGKTEIKAGPRRPTAVVKFNRTKGAYEAEPNPNANKEEPGTEENLYFMLDYLAKTANQARNRNQRLKPNANLNATPATPRATAPPANYNSLVLGNGDERDNDEVFGNAAVVGINGRFNPKVGQNRVGEENVRRAGLKPRAIAGPALPAAKLVAAQRKNANANENENENENDANENGNDNGRFAVANNVASGYHDGSKSQGRALGKYLAGKVAGNASLLPYLRMRMFYQVARGLFGKNNAHDKLCGKALGDSDSAYKFLRRAEQVAGCIDGNTVTVHVQTERTKRAKKTVTLVRRLGNADVWEAEWQGTQHTYPMIAWKIKLRDEGALLRMHAFSRLAVCNVCPHFPMLYGAVRCNKYYVAFTEPMHGNLGEWLNANRRPGLGSVIVALVQVMAALAAMHARGATHGALKAKRVKLLAARSAKVGERWSQYRVGNRDIYVASVGPLFVLPRVVANRTKIAPHCEVLRVLGMFRETAAANVVERLARIVRAQKPDAVMFLHSAEVLELLGQYSRGMVSWKREQKAMEGQAYDVVPKGYKPYRGSGDCSMLAFKAMRNSLRNTLRGAFDFRSL